MAGSNNRSEGDAKIGDGVYVSGHTDESITPPERALIHVYSALGLSQDTVAEHVNRSQTVVCSVLQDSRDRVNAGEDPLEVYADVVGYAMLVGPHGQQDGEEP